MHLMPPCVCNVHKKLAFRRSLFPFIATAYVHLHMEYLHSIPDRAKWLGIVWKCWIICWHLRFVPRRSMLVAMIFGSYMHAACCNTYERTYVHLYISFGSKMRSSKDALYTFARSQNERNDFVSFNRLFSIRMANSNDGAWRMHLPSIRMWNEMIWEWENWAEN